MFSSFLNSHLQPSFQMVTSFITYATQLLRKIKQLGQLLEGPTRYTTDGVGLYPKIPCNEGFVFLKKVLDGRLDKK